jgi:predicted nucleotidyltransferase component of viral defense system
MALLNPYGVEMGTSGLILQAQSREEIFADKLVAFALRPNRLKNRDLWDIAWLHQQQIKPALDLIKNKLNDHHAQTDAYLNAFAERSASLNKNLEIAKEFRKEMARFLPNETVKETVNSEKFWEYLSNLLESYHLQLMKTLKGKDKSPEFKM